MSRVERFDLDVPGGRRTVRVFVPTRGSIRGTIYFQDGQNVFAAADGGTPERWRAERALDSLPTRDGGGAWLGVGVDHLGARRAAEYAPWPDRRFGAGGGAEQYEALVVGRVVPFVEERYEVPRTADTRAIVGSSLGGLVALWIAGRRPETFGRVGALSPSSMWSRHRLLETFPRRADAPLRVYVDAGSRESIRIGRETMDYGAAARRLSAGLRALGWTDRDLRVVLDPRGGHDERSWARRLPAALTWLVGGD